MCRDDEGELNVKILCFAHSARSPVANVTNFATSTGTECKGLAYKIGISDARQKSILHRRTRKHEQGALVEVIVAESSEVPPRER